MASDVHLVAVDAAAAQLDRAVELLHDLERQWSRFLPDSDISRINAARGARVDVHDSTLTLLTAMTEAWRVTDGRYDPTVLPALVAHGYVASIEVPSRTTAIGGGLRIGLADHLDIDLDARTVALAPGYALDPGGIGKGLAADLAVRLLLDGGARGALVGIGGDLAMGGRAPDPAGWLVAVEAPHSQDHVLCTLSVDTGGVATSSTRSRRWISSGRHRHHIIDPRTGDPLVTDLAAVTVVARSGWEAEAHATGALCAGSSGAIAYLERHRLSGVAVRLDGSAAATADLDPVHLDASAASR